MSYRWMKYLLAWLAPLGTLAGMLYGGWMTWAPLGFAFVLVPLIEVFVKPDTYNLTEVQQELAADDRMYDLLIWALVPFQWLVILIFLHRLNDVSVRDWELVGMVLSMGLMCGIVGINVAMNSAIVRLLLNSCWPKFCCQVRCICISLLNIIAAIINGLVLLMILQVPVIMRVYLVFG